MSAHIKAELFDLGPHNGMCEPDPKGSYHAFTLTEIGDKGDEPQRLSFMVPAHQLPTRADLCAERVQALEADNARLRGAIKAASEIGRIIGFIGDDPARLAGFQEECGPELLSKARAALTTIRNDD